MSTLWNIKNQIEGEFRAAGYQKMTNKTNSLPFAKASLFHGLQCFVTSSFIHSTTLFLVRSRQSS